MWTKQQISYHEKAASSLIQIKDEVFDYIQNNSDVTEYNVQQYIIKKFTDYKLETDKYPPIVSFDKNTAIPEHYPKKESKELKQNTFIMIDMWAKLHRPEAPFADITWVAFFGDNISEEIITVFNVVKSAREAALNYINRQLSDKIIPTGREVDAVVKDIIKKSGYENYTKHETGHVLGVDDDHGDKPNWIYEENKEPLETYCAYTIEPGIYLDDKFGIRSEINFYISDGYELVITTEQQPEIVKLRKS